MRLTKPSMPPRNQMTAIVDHEELQLVKEQAARTLWALNHES
jgi:hypothetical protein